VPDLRHTDSSHRGRTPCTPGEPDLLGITLRALRCKLKKLDID